MSLTVTATVMGRKQGPYDFFFKLFFRPNFYLNPTFCALWSHPSTRSIFIEVPLLKVVQQKRRNRSTSKIERDSYGGRKAPDGIGTTHSGAGGGPAG